MVILSFGLRSRLVWIVIFGSYRKWFVRFLKKRIVFGRGFFVCRFLLFVTRFLWDWRDVLYRVIDYENILNILYFEVFFDFKFRL